MEADRFKDAMSQLASAVTIVTTGTREAPHGTTVSAFMSLSLDPPMVLVSLDRRSSLLAELRKGTAVGINVLSTEQGALARRFAHKGIDRFAGVSWELVDAAPKLEGNHTWVAGDVSRIIEAGDHYLILVDVRAADVNSNMPLLYWQREFGTHGTIEAGEVRAQSVETGGEAGRPSPSV